MALFSVVLSAGDTAAQQRSLKEMLVGTWALAEAGPQWGANPKGYLYLGADGRYSGMIVRSDRVNYASNNRMQTSPAEDKATVQGTIATFGTYTVNEADRSYTIRVEGSSYPNWSGTDQKRFVESITADEVKVRNPTPSIGGAPTHTTYRRMK